MPGFTMLPRTFGVTNFIAWINLVLPSLIPPYSLLALYLLISIRIVTTIK